MIRLGDFGSLLDESALLVTVVVVVVAEEKVAEVGVAVVLARRSAFVEGP